MTREEKIAFLYAHGWNETSHKMFTHPSIYDIFDRARQPYSPALPPERYEIDIENAVLFTQIYTQ